MTGSNRLAGGYSQPFRPFPTLMIRENPMCKNLPTPFQIERWVPSHLDEVIGCTEARNHFRDILRNDGRGVNTLLSGPSGSGKTSTVKAFTRSLMCPNRDSESGRPCGKCDACRTFDVRYDDVGLFACCQGRTVKGESMNFFPVNCGRVTESELRKLLADRAQYEGLFLIYLDEVHRLIRRKMEHMLLVPLQEMDALWIASSAMTGELDRMFRRRFSAKIETTLPSVPEMVAFLGERCRTWGIAVDKHPETLRLLARRCRQITSDAIGRIAVAAGRKGRVLTRNLVLQPFE